jgi:putative addiction module component (TIGR02574 family)
MTASFRTLGIDRLSIDDRLSLVHEIWDSIAEDVENSPLTEGQKSELSRRVADLEANPDQVDTWDQIKEYLRRKR